MTSTEWLTIGESVAYLDEPIERIFKLLEQGTIVSEGFGNGQTLISKDSCDIWLANQKSKHNDAIDVTVLPAPRAESPRRRGRPKGAKSKQRAPKGYVTLSKAADLLGVHEDTPGAWARRGEIESLRSGGRVFIPKAAIAARLAPAPAPVTPAEPHFVDAKTAAVRRGVSLTTITETCRRGEVPGAYVGRNRTGGRKWFVPEAWVEEQKGSGADLEQTTLQPATGDAVSRDIEHELEDALGNWRFAVQVAEEARAEIADLTAQVLDIGKTCAELVETKREVQNELDAVSLAKAKADREVVALTRDLQKTTQSANDLRRELASAKERATVQGDHVCRLMADLDTSVARIQELESELAARSAPREGLRDAVRSLFRGASA